MKKKYAQPDILCEKLASCNMIITTSGYTPGTTTEPADPGTPGLAPKRRDIWNDED